MVLMLNADANDRNVKDVDAADIYHCYIAMMLIPELLMMLLESLSPNFIKLHPLCFSRSMLPTSMCETCMKNNRRGWQRTRRRRVVLIR